MQRTARDARTRYRHGFLRPYRYLPEEFDAYALVRLMVPYRGELRAMMDGPEPRPS